MPIERQLIVVQDGRLVAAARKEANKSHALDDVPLWSRIIRDPFFLSGGLVLQTILAAKEAYEAWSRARQSGLDILQISHTEAKQLRLPPGHPRQGTVYALHPTQTDTYYTMAAYHRLTFEHKFGEAIELLMSLGATSINVEHVRGWNRDFSATIGVTLPGAGVNGDLQAAANSESSLLFKATYQNEQIPTLPSNLHWYHNEPTWQHLTSGRLKYGLKNFSLAVAYEDDHGINAGLKMKAEKAGLDLGGAFQSHVATTWKISGDFNDRRPE